MLASEYGWTLEYIFNSLYLEEILVLLDKIKPRKNSEYRVLTAIIQSPHTKNPEKIFEILGKNDEPSATEQVDVHAGVERLKLVLNQNPRFVVK